MRRKKRIKQRAAVGVLGKLITRRSRGRCELCEQRDTPRLYELPPFPVEPDPDRTLMVCTRCYRWLEKAKIVPIEAHFLAKAAWAEEPAVRLAALRLLLSVDEPDDPWMVDALEAIGFDPKTQELTT